MTKRGEQVTVAGGPTGIYVGERNGLVWICYEPEHFTAMCAAFDRG